MMVQTKNYHYTIHHTHYIVNAVMSLPGNCYTGKYILDAQVGQSQGAFKFLIFLKLSPIPGRKVVVMSQLRSSPVSSSGILSRLKTEGWAMAHAERGHKLAKVAPGALMTLRCHFSVERWQR